MSYIGRNIDNLSDRVKLDAITASATTTYNLLLSSVAYTPSSAESLTVSLNGVIQAPQTSYTVSGSTIIFASTLASSDSIDFILAERAITLTTIGSGTVTTANLVDGSVTGAKFNADVISGQTALGATPADTDELLVSDAGVIKRVDYSYLKASNTPAFEAYLSASQTVTSASTTKLQANTEVVDTDTAYDNSTNYRFTVPSGKAGTYYFYAHIVLNQDENYLGYGDIRFYKNGSSIRKNSFENVLGTSGSYMKFMPVSLDMTLPLVASDYIEVFGTVGAFGGGSTHRFYSANNESYFGGYKIIV